MAKVLITSLGAGQKRDGGYQTANYQLDGKVYYNESIVARNYCDHYKIDKVFVIGTNKSLWDELFHRFGGDEDGYLQLYETKEKTGLDENDLIRVEQQLDLALNSNGSKCFIVQFGVDESELITNFSIYLNVSQFIEPGDEVYLDVTHSFRSLALMSFVMLSYIMEVKTTEFKVEKILYAMFENKIFSEDAKCQVVPVVDLSVLFDTIRWIKAISYFKNFGNAQMLSQLCQEKNDNTVKGAMKQLADSFSLNDLHNIGECLQRLKHNSMLIKGLKNIPYAKGIVNDIEMLLNRFHPENQAQFQFELAEWYYENKAYGLSYLCLAEAIVSKTCVRMQFNPSSKEGRENAKAALFNDDYATDLPNELKPIRDTFRDINQIRNAIAHQTDYNNAKPEDNIMKLKQYLGNCKLLR